MKELIIIIAYVIATYGLSEMVVFGYGPFGMFEKWRSLTSRISYGLGKLFSCITSSEGNLWDYGRPSLEL